MSRTYASSYRRSNRNYEQARRHIREAQELTAELGGTDKDVKTYFFGLSGSRLASVLDAYGQAHGTAARNYAEETIPAWRSGRRKMSGMVASRLFRLLPPRMSLQEKYALTEKLWAHVGPSSKKLVRFGEGADLDQITALVREHMNDVVESYVIPDSLARRFDWLSGGDVGVKQQLLNYLQVHERDLVVHGVRERTGVFLEHLADETTEHAHALSQQVTVGKHVVEVRYEAGCEGAHLCDWRPAPTPRSASTPAGGASKGTGLWWVVGIAALILFVWATSG